jgi:translation initiation factor 4E
MYPIHHSENLKNLGTVYSIEEFFQYYCYLMRPSEMPHNHKLMFFRKGCKPLWEVSQSLI